MMTIDNMYTDHGYCKVKQRTLPTSHYVDDNHKTLHSSAQSSEILAFPTMKNTQLQLRKNRGFACVQGYSI